MILELIVTIFTVIGVILGVVEFGIHIIEIRKQTQLKVKEIKELRQIKIDIENIMYYLNLD